MASAFSASKSTLAQLTTELEDSLMSITRLEKKGQLSKARATKARRAVQREYDDYCNAALVKNIVKKPTGGGGDGASTALAGEEDQEAGLINLWSGRLTVVARGDTYEILTSKKVGFAALLAIRGVFSLNRENRNLLRSLHCFGLNS